MLLYCGAGEDSWESLDSKEIKPVNPKENKSWIFIGRTDALWPLDAKRSFIGKDPDAGKNWGLEEKRATENEIVEWHHQLSEHESAQTPGDSEGKGILARCNPWGHTELDTTEWMNNNKPAPDKSYLETQFSRFYAQQLWFRRWGVRLRNLPFHKDLWGPFCRSPEFRMGVSHVNKSLQHSW